jgi:arachidonate 5-lipoxygenase
MHVACADNQYHQFIYHLGLAHLAMEPVVIAHQNAFLCEPSHAIGRLLRPHLYGTVGINFLARQTLVTNPQEAFTDRTFAPGTVQALELFRRYWQSYHFFKDSFPEDLAARGFDEAGSDGVEGYYYRDDGFKVWRALEEYVRDVVAVTYADDEAVAADRTLQIFAWECSSPDRGAVPGFPAAFDSRELLVKALTTILFRASAYHAAIDYPQMDYLSYVPNRPDSLFATMPEGGKEVSREFLLKALPGPRVSHFQISFAYLLTTPPENPITRLSVFAEDHPEIHERFMGNLARISASICARNEALVKAGMPAYPYLMPEQIPASVNI